MIKYELLDPRPALLSAELEKIAAWKEEGFKVIGFEVTIPAIAALLDTNIDPQHTGGDAAMSCIKACCAIPPIQENAVFLTVRADLDAVGGMVILSDSAHNFSESRINVIHEADCFTSAQKWQPRELFSEGYEQSELASIARAVSDFKVDFPTRVQWMREWLEFGAEPDGYRAAYESDRASVREALESGATKVEVRGSVAIVESRHRAATSIGYSKAPIVIALNDAFPSKDGSYRKFTICQYSTGYVDLSTVLTELSELEPGWGGSPTIGGSPQGVSSELSIEDVVAVVQKFAL